MIIAIHLPGGTYRKFWTQLLEGRPSSIFAIDPLADSLGVAHTTIRDAIRFLHERGCIVIEERSKKGHLVRVLLPTEIPGVIPQTAPALPIDIELLDFFTSRRYVTALLSRESGRCFYCLKDIRVDSCELDHVVSQVNGRDNTYRNIVCSCHDCNRSKQSHSASDFIRNLYRKGVLSQPELENRLTTLEQLQAGELLPELNLLPSTP
jgi:hypothetical protein